MFAAGRPSGGGAGSMLAGRGRTIPARDSGRGIGDIVWEWSTCPECRDRRWTR
jgi:hypothetical protein